MVLLGSSRRMSKFVRLRRTKLAIRQMLKHVQLLAVIGRVQIPWPEVVRQILETCTLFTTQIDSLLQLGCSVGEQTVVKSLAVQWFMPIGVVALVALATLISVPMGALLRRLPCARCHSFAQVIVQDGDSFIKFVYLIWSIYFATLTGNSLVIFTCRRHPNGALTVILYPELTCGSGEHWRLLAGGCCAVLLYVVLWFVVSRRALKRVSAALKSSCYVDGGPFEFVADGLRLPTIQFGVYSAAKDVLLNMAVVVFSADATSQLFASAAILAVWATVVLLKKPYDMWTSNVAEVWSSAGLAVVLLLTASLGYAIPGSPVLFSATVTSNNDLWLTAILLSTFGVPAVLILFELTVTNFGCVTKTLPARLLPSTRERVRQEVEVFRAKTTATELYDSLHIMDCEEWSAFLWAIGEPHPFVSAQFALDATDGEEVVPRERTTVVVVKKWSRTGSAAFKELSLQDEALRSVITRGRTLRMGSGAPNSDETTMFGTLRDSVRMSMTTSRRTSVDEHAAEGERVEQSFEGENGQEPEDSEVTSVSVN
mmetsp:Transcript_10567/g.27995  ORF Transcript_10567/g.27995 Transcript_10567/m.27995 type:complete len:540 (+) Transcript_10567:1-1620(+)